MSTEQETKKRPYENIIIDEVIRYQRRFDEIAPNGRGKVEHKLYGSGKMSIKAFGDEKYLDAATLGFYRALGTFVVIDAEAFIKTMREAGAPEEVIEEYLASYTIDDNIYMTESSPWGGGRGW